MNSEEDFFSEFYYPYKIVTENEGNVDVLSILRALPIWGHTINNLITLFAQAQFCKIQDFGLKLLIYGPRPEPRSRIKQKFHPSVWNFTVKPSRAVISS